jgi:hypothetical protein
MNLANLTLADLIGVWGGFVATIVLVWDIAKWHLSGPRLHVVAQPGMITLNIPDRDGKTFVVLSVSNYGERPTTINNLGLIHYRSWVHKLLGRPSITAIVNRPSDTHPIPYLIEPGTEWKGFLEQTPEIIEMGKSGRLYLILYHSHKDARIWRRVRYKRGYVPRSFNG